MCYSGSKTRRGRWGRGEAGARRAERSRLSNGLWTITERVNRGGWDEEAEVNVWARVGKRRLEDGGLEVLNI